MLLKHLGRAFKNQTNHFVYIFDNELQEIIVVSKMHTHCHSSKILKHLQFLTSTENDNYQDLKHGRWNKCVHGSCFARAIGSYSTISKQIPSILDHFF